MGFERRGSSGGDFNAGYTEFRRSVSQGCERRCSSVGVASGGDFNAGYAKFRRSVSQDFERWGFERWVILCVLP